ncbi:hypothetical protein CRG98_010604 [Punica granatum]|uniref:Reverse transcriptase domain-containing protein n=1 Tax=Punica granatum TaxID=22663 RepID=A0A2I0KMJ2_PUNGR|nr:hypothetical protein CRG98_010604 [Punica granatum]
MVFPKENPLSSFLKEQCEDNQMLVKDEVSDSVSEEEEEQESEVSPKESEDSWETNDSYPPVKMMGREDGVDSEDARSEMADPLPLAAATTTSKGNLVFTLDDIPYSRHMLHGGEDIEEINLVNSVSHVPVSIYTSKYVKPIKVIAFLDIGVAQTIMNPEVLPKECWKPHIKHFSSASSEVFSTHLISKPIKIQFFPGCYLITRVLGSALPRKDIVVGWDIITKTPRLFMAQGDEVKHILSELTTPSLFQKALCRVFAPIMDQALVYIDDILLFSPSEEAHIHLLRRFSEIIQDYGIMLSEKKMVIGQREINFLGMQLANDQCQPEPHMAQELLKYLEEPLTKKQIQQFLGTVNYLKDFLPKIAKLTRPLEKMLKKDAPAWGPTQTKVIEELKAQLQSLPPLQIPSTVKRILQTYASDRYWGVVLFEELNGKCHICGYRSGRFKPSEQHYHSTFKEILAVS